jgi:hypothetical protein
LLKVGAGLFAGATFLTLAAPLVAEAIAILPPPFLNSTKGPMDRWGLD